MYAFHHIFQPRWFSESKWKNFKFRVQGWSASKVRWSASSVCLRLSFLDYAQIDAELADGAEDDGDVVRVLV